MTAREVVDARKNPIPSAHIEPVLDRVAVVCVARGKAFACMSLSDLRNDVKAFGKMFGQTKNLRAPAIIVGDKLLVGFNAQMYDSVFND